MPSFHAREFTAESVSIIFDNISTFLVQAFLNKYNPFVHKVKITLFQPVYKVCEYMWFQQAPSFCPNHRTYVTEAHQMIWDLEGAFLRTIMMAEYKKPWTCAIALCLFRLSVQASCEHLSKDRPVFSSNYPYLEEKHKWILKCVYPKLTVLLPQLAVYSWNVFSHHMTNFHSWLLEALCVRLCCAKQALCVTRCLYRHTVSFWTLLFLHQCCVF